MKCPVIIIYASASPSIRLQCKSQKWLISFFWVFMHEVSESQSKKIDEGLLFK